MQTLFDFQETRLLTLIEGVLAANIFDWGSSACVDLYHKGTIIEIYRMSRKKMQRPWRVSAFLIFYITLSHLFLITITEYFAGETQKG